jgi:hypothetical protein
MIDATVDASDRRIARVERILSGGLHALLVLR